MGGIADPIAIMPIQSFQNMRLQSLFVADEPELGGMGFLNWNCRQAFDI